MNPFVCSGYKMFMSLQCGRWSLSYFFAGKKKVKGFALLHDLQGVKFLLKRIRFNAILSSTDNGAFDLGNFRLFCFTLLLPILFNAGKEKFLTNTKPFFEEHNHTLNSGGAFQVSCIC